MQSGLNKTISSTAKQTSTSTSTSPSKQQSPKSQTPNSQQSPDPQSQNQQQQQNSPQQQQSSVQTQSTKQSSTSISNFGQPLTTLANGFNSSIPPIPTTHSISSPISNQSAITNGNTPNNLSAIAQQQQQQPPPSSLPVGVPHPVSATAPTALTPSSVHPGLDNAVATGRTNSPAVATSAVLSAAAPATNGNSNATTVSANGGLNAYRTAYPGYPLYAPYSSSPYLPPTVLSPSASPRTVDSRTNRESPLVNSKGIRPITPTTVNNNGIPPTSQSTALSSGSQQQQPLNLREQSTHLTSLPLQKTHSPRGHSPTRERDSYR